MQGDPYALCEKDCTHDLAAGVRVTDLRSGDGGHRVPFLEPRPLLLAGWAARNYEWGRRVRAAAVPPDRPFPD